ncbi:MAG: FHA domain-containing protein [Muribaculaceae bacterium]|nr:FHA domain-containing protein [Muribaculaceae bacterium]
MRILKIGRARECDITFPSSKVSSLHAELMIRDNGDYVLEDKDSTNGTFVMNKRVRPGVPVTVRRGDSIRFGDTTLNWAQIPEPEDNSQFRAIYSIGSNLTNDVRVTGSTVSRFHATLKIDRKGHAFIQDHSSNGTMVNGTRIVSGQNVAIKRDDAVVCGGVPVSIKQYIPSNQWAKALRFVGLAAAVIGIVVGGYFLHEWLRQPAEPSLDALADATAMVYGAYYIDVEYKNDPLINMIDGWPRVWRFGIITSGKQRTFGLDLSWYGARQDFSPMEYTGTAFFISDKGELGTNRHIASPWSDDVLEAEYKQTIYEQMQTVLNALIPRYIDNPAIQAAIDQTRKSDIVISGHHEFLGVLPRGRQANTINDFLPCQVIADSGDENKDVALLRLNNVHTPDDIVKNGYFNIMTARTDARSLKLNERLITIGFPKGFSFAYGVDEKIEINPTVNEATVGKVANNNQFQIQCQSYGGQSGSPVIDENRHLVGVLWGGFADVKLSGLIQNSTNLTLVCNIEHLVELYNKHHK